MPTGVYERKPTVPRMSTCHPARKHFGKGMCNQCYHKVYHRLHKNEFVDEFGAPIPEGFYTYLWFRENGTPYYVGKGCGKRAYVNHGHSFHRPTSKARIFVQYWDSEDKAFEIEKWYISLYGRKGEGEGMLRNLTDGGENPPSAKGLKRSEETKEKMSKAQKGPNSFWYGRTGKEHNSTGIKRSEETKQKLRNAWIRRRICKAATLNLNTGRSCP